MTLEDVWSFVMVLVLLVASSWAAWEAGRTHQWKIDRVSPFLFGTRGEQRWGEVPCGRCDAMVESLLAAEDALPRAEEKQP